MSIATLIFKKHMYFLVHRNFSNIGPLLNVSLCQILQCNEGTQSIAEDDGIGTGETSTDFLRTLNLVPRVRKDSIKYEVI